ncbi:hypothetical protein BCR39DRAFT_521150 [Naematelia encephala]|uniref:Exocyst complex component EXO84 n=1 Tax=Naematelia encephala TaxID=71784 RepID=A0A1Y2BE29_9TREE|nr:hypothetical protein BCR39DRAFT_521150 [Naematelia encephala]
MASLRRPSQAIPGGARPVSNSRPPLPSDAPSRKQDARKSKVGDKIRKRMSTRFAGANDVLSEPPPLPGQPSSFLTRDPYQTVLDVDQPLIDDDDVGASKFAQWGSPEFAQQGFGAPQDEQIRRRGAADMTREDEWDLNDLGEDGLDVNQFIRRNLAGADDDEIKRFKAALNRAKQLNAKEMQRNVFKNYAQFVVISKEISTLENDMLELKELLSQWKDLPQLMGMEDTLAPTLDKHGNLERRRTQRNSVLDLQQVYKTQLTTLWSTVEGSQKYLPLVPGRHLVFETHHFVELNAATYKAKQSVSMFLLNDLLLIAGRRRTKAAPGAIGDEKERERGRMVAERCWVLADLVVVDVKDSGDLTNALKIRRGKETCVYRTSKAEDKKGLLAAFRRVSQELGEKKRKESEREQERRKSMWQGDGLNGLNGVAMPVPSMSPGRPLSMIGLSVADTKDLRWIDEFGDDLTMAIATRDWDEAVKQIEKGQDLLKTVSSNPAAKNLLTARLEQLRPSLSSQIVHDLSSAELRKSGAARLISLLCRLDLADLARTTFLNSRHEVMFKRVRAIRAEGDISIYISELAIVCFTVIRHTSDWYMNAFKENRMASGFVTWAKEQIEIFADLFRRQVYAPTIADGVAEECLRVVASHNRKLLRDVGLDFTFLLTTLLQPDSHSSSSNAPPVFDLSTMSATPAPGYHIESSPYVPLIPETPAPESAPITGSTQPLSIRSPRRSRPSDASRQPPPDPRSQDLLSPGNGSPTPPPRSMRRLASSRTTSHDDGDDSLR